MIVQYSVNLRVNDSELAKLMGEVKDSIMDGIRRGMGETEKRVHASYTRHTVGMKRISRFLNTEVSESDDLMSLKIDVSAQNGARKGANLNDRPSANMTHEQAWNSIVVQTELGVLRDVPLTMDDLRSRTGKRRIVSPKKLMAIATDPSRSGMSPRAFRGKWIKSRRNPATRLFVRRNPPGTVPRDEVLFIGRRDVAVRKPTPFLKPMMDETLNAYPVIMETELKKTSER